MKEATTASIQHHAETATPHSRKLPVPNDLILTSSIHETEACYCLSRVVSDNRSEDQEVANPSCNWSKCGVESNARERMREIIFVHRGSCLIFCAQSSLGHRANRAMTAQANYYLGITFQFYLSTFLKFSK